MRIPCNGTDIGLDNSKGDISFLSHAHSDHTSGLKKQKQLISTKATLELAGIDAEILSPSGTCLINAGHILGARQLVVENDGEKIVYTGDISIKPNFFGWKAEIPECDRIIMDATYGDPKYSFPLWEQTYEELSGWIRKNEKNNIIIGCYDLGKAQELIAILNEFGVTPVVTRKTERFCSIYEKYGIMLDRAVVGSDEAEEIMKSSFVGLVPMRKAKRYFAARMAEAFGRKTRCAVATGWSSHYRFNVDASFALSNHADFEDLVYYVEKSGAAQVEFFCGDGSRVLQKLKLH